MPNWCTNIVTFEHEDPAMIRKIIRGYNKNELMSTFFPCPQELQDTVAGGFPAGTPEARELELKQKLNKEKYGFANWYDWQLHYWSTKWDVGHGDGPKATGKKGTTAITLRFESAWSPPIAFYERLAGTYGYRVRARYWEPGMGFVGAWSIDADDVISDEYFEYSRAKAGEEIEYITRTVPAGLINEFNLIQEFADDA